MANLDRITHDFRREERHLTKVFKALSDGTRQRSCGFSKGASARSARSLGTSIFPNRRSPVTCRLLKEAELVVDQRQGQNVIYRLNDNALSTSMQEFFRSIP